MEENKVNRITSIFLLISAVCLVAVWLIMYCTGQMNDYFDGLKFKTIFLLTSEFITAVLMFISGIYYLVRKRNFHSMRMFSLGMLFYAILIATGEFTDRKIYALTILFSIVAVFTIIICIINLKEKKTSWN